jgi:hypothetical protein
MSNFWFLNDEPIGHHRDLTHNGVMVSSDAFFQAQQPAAVFKHGVLLRYSVYFAGRAGRQTRGQRDPSRSVATGLAPIHTSRYRSSRFFDGT